jgi:hypothetical protein
MRLKSSLKLAVLLVAGLFAIQMMAQTTTSGDLAGTVTDPSNAVVSGAGVSVTSVDTGANYTTKTTSTGSYRAPSLKPGDYKVTVTQSGFRTTVETVTVALGAVTTANIQLQVGQGSETVEVTGAAPLIQTEDANISTAFTQKQVDLLPNGGNDLTAVAQTAPGVQMNTSSGGGYGNFNAFGLPATSNLFTVNGNDENDPYLNLNNSGATNLLLGKNEVQETAVVSNGYTGQYGRMAGAQVDYATKSGTNDWHGNAQYFYNSGGFNANDWFNNHTAIPTPLPEEVNNQWAASIGGPVKKDKLFFFFDTEGLRYILGTSNLAIIPTQTYANAVTSNLAADSALGAGILFGTPVTGASVPFYQNMFAQYQNAPGLNRALPTDSTIDGTNNLGCGDLNVGGNFYPALAQFGGLPSTFNNAYGTNNGGGGVPCSQYFRSTVGQLSHEYILAGRVDYNMSNTDKLFFRARFDRGIQPTFTDIVNPSLWNATSVQPQDEGQVNWTHTFSPTVLNQFVGSVLYYSAFFADPNQAAAQAAFGDGAGHGFAFIDFDTSAFSTLGGENYAFPQGRNVTQYQLIDDLSITRGPHALKMGFNFRRNDITDGIFGARAVTAEMISSSQTYLDGGYIIEGAQRFPSKLEQPMAIYSFGLYAQDEYRISSRLKLTLTLRADRNSNMSCPDGCFSNIAGGAFNGIGHNNATPFNQVIDANQNQMVPQLEKVVFQPRFGFAWTPTSKQSTVIRGGVGLFSDLYPGTLADNFARNAPSLNSFALVVLPFSPAEPGNAEATLQGCNNSFISNFNAGGNADTFASSPLTPAGCKPPIYNAVDSKLQNPKYLEWNLELQQQIGNKTSFTLNYVGNHGYDEFVTDPWLNSFANAGSPFGGLPGPNTTDPTIGTCAVGCSFLQAPDGHFRNVLQLTNSGVSNYNGLTATVTRRFTAGFSGSLNYTWSHSLDDISNGGILPYSGNDSFLNQYNPYCLQCLNYGNADYDVRHNITGNYVWELPFKSSNKAMNFVESGWTFSQTIFWHSGYPYSAVDEAAPSLGVVGNGTSATYLATFNGGPTSPGCSTPDTPCLSGSQFNTVGGETGFGNIARNSFRGASYFNSDFTLLKNFPITERINFGLGASAYNVFNHASFSNPVPDISSGQFGTIQQTVVPPTSPYGSFVGSAVSGRLLQLQARVTF